MTRPTLPSRVHFIGIGGAGMSAIAKVLLERGHEVTGSDLKASRTTRMLEAIGATIWIGHDAAHVDGAGAAILSSAIAPSNPEVVRAGELGLEVIARGEALARVLEGMTSIVVSGTHGKTTTTSMIVTILRTAEKDPTYLIGAGLNDIGTNARAGSSELAVAESDESDGSFLLLSPSVAVVTNIEMDHVDHWSSLDDLREAFGRFITSGPLDGMIVIPSDDAELAGAASSSGRAVITVGPGGSVSAEGIEQGPDGTTFTLTVGGDSMSVHLRVPGLHNVANAISAAAACSAVGLPLSSIASGVEAYRGVERRFQVRGQINGVTIIDDYAHHPTEVAATLAAARPGPYRRVVAVFQPHRFSRTAALARGFGRSFGDADRIVLMDVYGAGEAPVPGVTGKLIADAVTAELPGRPVAYFPHRDDLLRYLEQMTRPGDVLLTLGAGDVTSVGEELIARAGERGAGA